MHILLILEIVKCNSQFPLNFDVVVHVPFKIPLTVINKLNECNFLRGSWVAYEVVVALGDVVV